MSRADDFGKALDRAFEEKVVKKFVELHRAVAMSGFQMITADSRQVGFSYGSPYWTGRFAGSTNIAIGSVVTSVLPPHPEKPRWPDEPDDPYRAKPLSAAATALLGLQPFDVVYISNALPYARKIEAGSSQKAPAGVFEVAALALKEKFQSSSVKKAILHDNSSR